MANDHPVTLASLKLLLFFEQDIEVVGSVGSATEALALAHQLRPDVVLIDIDMPGMDGITAAAQLKASLPATRIILMSVEREHPQLPRALQSGVSSFVTKPVSAHNLTAAIRQTVRVGGHPPS